MFLGVCFFVSFTFLQNQLAQMTNKIIKKLLQSWFKLVLKVFYVLRKTA